LGTMMASRAGQATAKRRISKEKEERAAREERERLVHLQNQKDFEASVSGLEEEIARRQACVQEELNLLQQQYFSRQERELAGIMDRFDTNSNGTLEPEELSALLVASNMPQPSERALAKIMKKLGSPPTLEQIKAAVASYRSYLNHQRKLDQLFTDIDVSGEGVIDLSELRAYLSFLLSDLQPQMATPRSKAPAQVTDTDILHVLTMCGRSIDQPILRRDDMEVMEVALSQWMDVRLDEAVNGVPVQQKSPVCSLL